MNDGGEDPLARRLVQSYGLLAAVRRQGSFTGAARTLGVDPSAVSHRVRALEGELGLTLFTRSTRSVAPTRAGRVLCEAASRAFAEAELALAAAQDLRSDRAIRLSTPSSVAMKWLLPRLPDAASAGLELSIDVAEGLAPLGAGAVDAGLRFGKGPYPGLHATRLSGCVLQPVAAPGRARGDPLEDPAVPLLADAGAERSGTGIAWADYRALRGAGGDPPNPVRRFDRADLALQAAIAGLGVAMGRSLLIEDDLSRGLLAPAGAPARATAAYWLVTRPEMADAAGMVALRIWLIEQIRLTKTTAPG